MCLYVDGAFSEGYEASGFMDVVRKIEQWHPDLLIIEDFQIGPRPSLAKPPLKIIGIVEYICHISGITFITQSPSVLRLMKQRAESLHRSVHVRSACAHVIYYQAKCRI